MTLPRYSSFESQICLIFTWDMSKICIIYAFRYRSDDTDLYWVSQKKVYLMYTILYRILRTRNNIDIYVYGCVTKFLRDFDKFPYLIIFLFHDILFRVVFLFTGRKRVTFFVDISKTIARIMKMKNYILNLTL